MNIAGRWIPIEVANNIVLLWAIEAALVIVLLLWLRRQRRPPRSGQNRNTPSVPSKKLKVRRKQ